MNNKKLSSPIYEYVQGVYKGSGKTLGEIASEARIFESGINVFLDGLEAKEELER